MEDLSSYDPENLIVGILGGSKGTTRDCFELIKKASTYGAKVALFGRKINLSEDPISLVKIMRAVVEKNISSKEAVKMYHNGLSKKKLKSDNSPLTIADKEAHRIICEKLNSDFPSLPILSEESENITFEERKDWTTFFLVDPLDGTKEFINKSDDFTVNIALIHNKKVVFGAVGAPASGRIWNGSIIGKNQNT